MKKEQIKRALDSKAIKKSHLELIGFLLKDAERVYQSELVPCRDCGGRFPRYFHHGCKK